MPDIIVFIHDRRYRDQNRLLGSAAAYSTLFIYSVLSIIIINFFVFSFSLFEDTSFLSLFQASLPKATYF